jgi:hypothetical protein
MKVKDPPCGRPVDQFPQLSTARAPISWTRRRVFAELLHDGSMPPPNVADWKKTSSRPARTLKAGNGEAWYSISSHFHATTCDKARRPDPSTAGRPD